MAMVDLDHQAVTIFFAVCPIARSYDHGVAQFSPMTAKEKSRKRILPIPSAASQLATTVGRTF